MQTTYRIKAQEINIDFLKSLKVLFAGQEVEITVRSLDQVINKLPDGKTELLEMVQRNRKSAPVIAADIDIRSLIDKAQFPDL